MKFRVEVSRTVAPTREIEVEARNEVEARAKALAVARHLGFFSDEKHVTDGAVYAVEAIEAEPTREEALALDMARSLGMIREMIFKITDADGNNELTPDDFAAVRDGALDEIKGVIFGDVVVAALVKTGVL